MSKSPKCVVIGQHLYWGSIGGHKILRPRQTSVYRLIECQTKRPLVTRIRLGEVPRETAGRIPESWSKLMSGRLWWMLSWTSSSEMSLRRDLDPPIWRSWRWLKNLKHQVLLLGYLVVAIPMYQWMSISSSIIAKPQILAVDQSKLLVWMTPIYPLSTVFFHLTGATRRRPTIVFASIPGFQ